MATLQVQNGGILGAARARRGRSYRVGAALMLSVTILLLGTLFALMLRRNADPGTRVWLLNHTPDQVIIVNPFNGAIEKKFVVADGLKELAFSLDYTRAYVANVVDVSNRLTVLDAKTYLDEERFEVDGVPQGIGVFPDNHKLAVILGSKTDFMAGGFDVIDLDRQSKADPQKKLRLYRERELRLTHKIAVGDDGDRIYCIDAKSSKINIFSFTRKGKVGEVDLHGAPEELLYPRAGKYYYVSILAHQAIYQLDKQSDTVQAAYVYELRDPSKPFHFGRLRYMAVDRDARFLFGTNYERKTVAIWRIGDINYMVNPKDVPEDPNDERYYRWPVPHWLPFLHFKLKGGYNPDLKFIPGGQQVAVDPANEFLYVMDDEGGFYIYELSRILQAKEMSTPEPHKMIILGRDVEVRDLKVSLPAAVHRAPKGSGG